MKVGSSRLRPFFNCKADITPPGCLMLPITTVRLLLVTIMYSGKGIGMTVFNKEFHPQMRSTTKSTLLVHVPNFKDTFLETPTIGKTSELAAFILPMSFSIVNSSQWSSCSDMKSRVAPESTMVLAGLELIVASTNISPFSGIPLGPLTFFLDSIEKFQHLHSGCSSIFFLLALNLGFWLVT